MNTGSSNSGTSCEARGYAPTALPKGLASTDVQYRDRYCRILSCSVQKPCCCRIPRIFRKNLIFIRNKGATNKKNRSMMGYQVDTV